MPHRTNSRFQLLRKLGEGGMGIVYEAYDRLRKKRIALKKLRNASADSVFRFKREFRALRDISHPNIITLYELVSERDDWYLTMEVIDGLDFVVALRGELQAGEDFQVDTSTIVTVANARNDDTDTGVTEPIDTPYTGMGAGLPTPPAHLPDVRNIVPLDRVWHVLRQLARVLRVLHSAGIVHRDLKPSNVLVTRTDRVVLMDFGIVALSSSLSGSEPSDLAVGTPGYMAPEQVRGVQPTAAADWYAFGVMMYAVLTGTLPFVGSEAVVLRAKQQCTPLPPSHFAEHIPATLEALCMSLLTRDSTQRPNGDEVLQQLGLEPLSDAPLIDATPTSLPSDVFVGREAELQHLQRAGDAAQGGQSRCVIVRGPLGIGKSSLIERYLEQRECVERAPLVLAGRCHERESVHYKALDSIIDQLSSYLTERCNGQHDVIDVADLSALLQVFPVLRRVPAYSDVDRPTGPPNIIRHRAVTALRALLSDLAQARPLILVIEDLQWADGDSLDLLLELLWRPVPDGLLVLMTLCGTGLDSRETLWRPIQAIENLDLCSTIALQPFSMDEQRALARAIAGTRTPLSESHHAAWVGSGGHPMFLAELARHAADHNAPLAMNDALRLEDIIITRVHNLPANERVLLDLIALAGEPMPMRLLADVGTLSLADVERGSALLRINHLARISRSDDEPWLDVYHEKVRHALLECLPEQRGRALHEELALALERWQRANAAQVARQWLLAGNPQRASRYLMQAAANASANLAFEQAARLYASARDLMPAPDRDLGLAAPDLPWIAQESPSADSLLITTKVRRSPELPL